MGQSAKGWGQQNAGQQGWPSIGSGGEQSGVQDSKGGWGGGTLGNQKGIARGGS